MDTFTGTLPPDADEPEDITLLDVPPSDLPFQYQPGQRRWYD